MVTKGTIKDEHIREIFALVVDNSDKDYWWFRWSEYTSSSLFKDYSVVEDEEIRRLCVKAYNEAEEHSDNLGAYIEELEAKVKEGIPLEPEFNNVAYTGPSSEELRAMVEAWSKKHEGFSVEKLHEDEFILGYCKGKIKQELGYIPMPMHMGGSFFNWLEWLKFQSAEVDHFSLGRDIIYFSRLICVII